eukprot:5651-Chlamydomonas_euryale.AAC.1
MGDIHQQEPRKLAVEQLARRAAGRLRASKVWGVKRGRGGGKAEGAASVTRTCTSVILTCDQPDPSA